MPRKAPRTGNHVVSPSAAKLRLTGHPPTVSIAPAPVPNRGFTPDTKLLDRYPPKVVVTRRPQPRKPLPIPHLQEAYEKMAGERANGELHGRMAQTRRLIEILQTEFGVKNLDRRERTVRRRLEALDAGAGSDK